MAVKYQSRSSKLTLAVTSSPTTTQYIVGDTLNLSGMVVTATRRDGTSVNVTSSCTISPANGSTISSSGTITITATYHGKTATTTVTSYAIDRIAVTTAPTKTTYYYGDTMSYSGIVVTAYANNDAITRDVTTSCSYNPASGTKLTSTGSFSATITWRNKSTTQSYSVTAKIYGVEWAGGSSSALTRTDDAANFGSPSPAINNGNGSSPFDNIMPWSGMERVVEAGQNQVLVKIPKFYYKWTRNGSKLKLQISMVNFTGSDVSPAHRDLWDGKGERDYVYVGAYPCADVPSSSLFHYRSLSGRTPITNITRATARSNIHSYVGNSYWQWDYAMLWTIRMLYLVEYADWNSQNKIGYGCGNGSSLESTGKTDSMVYHTGTNASSRTSYGHVRYRYIEDLWGNVYNMVDGIRINSSSAYVIYYPSQFSDSSNGTYVGSIPTVTGITKSWTNPSTYSWALLPNTVDSNVSTSEYICDQGQYFGSGSTGVVATGAPYLQSTQKGLFYTGVAPSSSSAANIGCRLMKLP